MPRGKKRYAQKLGADDADFSASGRFVEPLARRACQLILASGARVVVDTFWRV